MSLRRPAGAGTVADRAAACYLTPSGGRALETAWMLRLLTWIAVVAGGAALALGVYLGARVIEQQTAAPAAVAAIIADMDPRIDALPQRRLDIVVRVEDPTFWTNDGIDMSTPGAGQTTLSQGLGKRIFFRRFSPGPAKLGKLELMVLTRFALTPKVSKRDIVRAALANAYLGRGPKGPVVGVAEGARRWFGKELDQLSEAEFIGLIAMLPAPNNLDPLNHPDANAERVARIERLLIDACTPLDVNDVALKGCEI